MAEGDDPIPLLNTAAKLYAHEVLCAERYKNLTDQLSKLDASLTEAKSFMFRMMYIILFGMGSTCLWLITHYVLGK